jgi:hypothetical protein
MIEILSQKTENTIQILRILCFLREKIIIDNSLTSYLI